MSDVATSSGSGVMECVDAVRKIQTMPPLAVARASSGRFETLDAARGIAACLIVAHHLAVYGRASDVAMGIAPSSMIFLYDHARLVVQLFLVLGGFAIAWSTFDRALGLRQEGDWSTIGRDFANRYLRLVIPYGAMLVFLLVVATGFGAGVSDPPLIESISWLQLVAHLFFLQDLLGCSNLSAGTWYLCIDIQYAAFYFLLLGTVGWLRRNRNWDSKQVANAVASVLIPLGILSAWLWNRNPDNDATLFYFMGPMILGSLIAWERKGLISSWTLGLYALGIASSLWFDFRPRFMVGLASGLFLWLNVHYLSHVSMPRFWKWLGKISYSLFLIHYTVNWLVMTTLDDWMGDNPVRGLMVMVTCFVSSVIAGSILHYAIEQPALGWIKRRSSRVQPQVHRSEQVLSTS